MRTLIIVSAAALLAVMAAPETIAQQGKKKAATKCPANFQQICMQRCTSRGGQARFCPQYCAQQERERCPR